MAIKELLETLCFFGWKGCQNIIAGVLHGLHLQMGHDSYAL
jgi:hypothetical protein